MVGEEEKEEFLKARPDPGLFERYSMNKKPVFDDKYLGQHHLFQWFGYNPSAITLASAYRQKH